FLRNQTSRNCDHLGRKRDRDSNTGSNPVKAFTRLLPHAFSGVGMRSLAYERRACVPINRSGLGPITAHLHVAPTARAIARRVQKDPAAIRGRTLLEPSKLRRRQ